MRNIRFYWHCAVRVISRAPLMPKVKGLHKRKEFDELNNIMGEVLFNETDRIKKLTKIEIEGEGIENVPEGEAVLYVSNHQGNFDPIVFIWYIRRKVGFVVKKELEKIPVLRTWIKLIGSSFIDRKSVRSGIQSIQSAAENIKSGNSIIIFPEGTRSKSDNVGEFKGGSFKIAEIAKCRVVPVAISGTYRIMEEDAGFIKPAKVRIKIGEPIDTSGFSKQDFKELPLKAREIIEHMIMEIKEK